MSMMPGQPMQGMGGGMDMSALMKLLQPQAPQGMMGGQQMGPAGQLPGAPPSMPGQPGVGAPPSAAPTSGAGRDKIASALMGQAGKGMQAGGSPTGSALGGAMQGASLAGAATGKSPMSMISNMMAPKSPMGGANPLTDPISGNSDPMSFANSLNGMPENPATAGLDGLAGNMSDAQIGMNQAYLDSLSPAGVDQMFGAAPAVDAGAGLGAGAELGAGLGGAEAGAGAISAADLGLGLGGAGAGAAAAEMAPAIPAALEGGAAMAGADAAAAAGAGAAMGPVGWAGLGIAGLMSLLGSDIF